MNALNQCRGRLLFCLALVCSWTTPAVADDYYVHTSYENHWFLPGPATKAFTNYFGTNAATMVFGGHVLGNSTNTLPSGGGYGLVWSSFGQPVEGIQADVSIGDSIMPPPGTDTNQPPANFVAVRVGENPAAYYECTDPKGGAFWVPSTHQIVAAQPNNISIAWRNTAGGTNYQVVNVNGIPASRAARLFWTESPFDAPVVAMSGLFPTIHYNTEVTPPVYDVTTVTNGGFVISSTNIISGVWLDDQKQLHAKNVSGLFIVEYYEEGNYSQQVQPSGFELVQVLEPNLQLVNANIGARLMPVDTYWANLDGINGLLPSITKGANDTAYLNSLNGPKDNWVYAVKRTSDEPWALEIYWQHQGRMNVVWPYEVDWYSCDWPAFSQRYVLGDNAPSDGPPVLIPSTLTATLMDDMDPPLHATLSSSGRSFSATQPGHCLLKYTTQDDIWFEVVETVSHTNSLMFDLEPKPWPIGEELVSGDPEAHALRFDGRADYVMAGRSFLNTLPEWTLSLAFNASQLGSTIYSEGTSSGGRGLSVRLASDGQVEVSVRNGSNPGGILARTTNAPVTTNQWQQLAVTLSGASDTQGTLQIYVDDFSWQTKGFPRMNLAGSDAALMGGSVDLASDEFFQGKLDTVRVWSSALSGQQISSNRFAAWPATAGSLVADFPFYEGQGLVVHNVVGNLDASVYGDPVWGFGQHVPLDAWSAFPGYIHVGGGDGYNVGRYSYPTEAAPDSASYVFAVNPGTLEVWWANQTLQSGMPAVYYPSRVVRYTNTWPENPAQIVIASGLGSSADALVLGTPSVYVQNDPGQPGYNPNEEHAFVLDGVAYALRSDLNGPASSDPFVLVDYLDPTTARPKMKAYSVVTTNSTWGFTRELTAGLPIEPILPLGGMSLCTNNYSLTMPPAWQDRKLGWWAVAAGADGGTAEAVLYFYYQMQSTFSFPNQPANAQPRVGSELPWCPTGGKKTPIPFTYHVSWPTNSVPGLQLGQTLTVAAGGLPNVWDQLSVDVEYDQSAQLSRGPSVTLFDPLVASGVSLDSGVVQAMITAKIARQETTSPYVRFPELPPSLYSRIYYDPTRKELMLQGVYNSTLTGSGYLLVNLLEPFEHSQAASIASALSQEVSSAWSTAVNGLKTDPTPIAPNAPFVKAALGAKLTTVGGYVTLAFNNSTNRQQVTPSQPISLAIIKVVPQLCSGSLEVLQPADALAEQLSLRYSADLAGQVSKVDFQWRSTDPVGGLLPNQDFGNWNPYGPDYATGTNEVSLTGANPFVMTDHYFAVRFRPTDTSGPTGTNWSEWTYGFAPGWVKRAMTGVNPFQQMFQDTVANAVDTRVTMVSQAGGPYEGDTPLNLTVASSAGLISTYQTIFNRAKSFSLDIGQSNPNLNQTLLFAASRLHDLYMLLGNEAFADAQDPTVAFPRSLAEDQHGADATSIFPFMNQVPNLLEEELALLHGRDDTLQPSVHTSPTYNRLFWNFTQGINGGEAAYAYNYNLKGTTTNTVGLITADDAKRLYPQGHGDAWGHYLSAISPYYDLLSYELFQWQTAPESTLVGNATISTDYFDEQKFVETAAARARTGAQIVQQTFRQRYSEDPTGRWPGYTDSNTDRAWGIGDWASRAGQAAYYDWAVANSLLLPILTNMVQVGGANLPPEGIQKIDRASTPELSEIAQSFRSIQSQVDAANTGLNPLGLARSVVPFDIDPTAIDAGQTHFEQIYNRALQALYNACVAFDHSRGATAALRDQSDSAYDMEEALTDNETDYHNRLVELYGYPYSDDIGPGKTYPQGYAGPDLINWQILDLENLLVNAPTGQVMQVRVANLGFNPGNKFEGGDYSDYTSLPTTATTTTNNLGTISVSMADNGLRVKPSGWTGQRRAQGELQLALSDFVQSWYGLDAKIAEYNQTLVELTTDIEHRMAEYDRYPGEWEADEANRFSKVYFANLTSGLEIAAEAGELLAASIKDGGEAVVEVIPHIQTGVAGIFPLLATDVDPSKVPKPLLVGAFYGGLITSHAGKALATASRTTQEIADANLEAELQSHEYQSMLQWNTEDTMVKIRSQYVKQAELFAQVQTVAQSYQRVQTLLGGGQRLLTERGQVRARAAQRIQSGRYADISFRIFRNDALRRYQAAFDLAARYTYMAAKAYDYETGLLSSDTARTPGSRFLEDVVRARLPGRFYVWLGTPMVGGSAGEPGLADILARMKGDWDVVKGRFGFNTPDNETSQFSLRSELFRISPASGGDSTWAQTLENCKVANIHAVPEFIRYCRPYTDITNVEPGLVIPFSTCVIAGQNFFGNSLAAGDNAYDASHTATKIRSSGVWFTGFNNTFNTNGSGSGLANEPRVYLIPVGQDVMRSPTRNGVATRSWTVFDQAIPLPYNVGGAEVDSPDWNPVTDSLREPLAQLRRHGSFRAYHDAGDFDQSETYSSSRLVGRSVWNTQWLLIIPGRTLLSDADEGIERFVHGALNDGVRAENGIQDIKVFFQTYSLSGD